MTLNFNEIEKNGRITLQIIANNDFLIKEESVTPGYHKRFAENLNSMYNIFGRHITEIKYAHTVNLTENNTEVIEEIERRIQEILEKNKALSTDINKAL